LKISKVKIDKNRLIRRGMVELLSEVTLKIGFDVADEDSRSDG